MARHINIDEAKAEHYDFALRIYLLTMRSYMQELGVWDEQQQRASFAAQWKREEVRIISVNGKDVGWLQFAELPTEIRLQKFFVSPQSAIWHRIRSTEQLTCNLEVDAEEDCA